MCSCLLPLHSAQNRDVFADVFVHAFPIMLSFDEVISSIYYLVT